MNDFSSQPEREQDNEQLTAEDMAILQAFEERDAWMAGPLQASSSSEHDVPLYDELDDMLMVFASEIDEDINRLRHTLSQLEQDDTLDLSRLTPIRRIAHKIRGTAGSVNYDVIGAIGTLIEEIVLRVTQHLLFPLIGISFLVQAVHALEMTLQSLLETGQESIEPLKNLEDKLVQFNISPTSSLPDSVQPVAQQELSTNKDSPDASPTSASLPSQTLSHYSSLRVDEVRFQQLIQGAEQLAEQRTPLENAQTQLQDALQELQFAQNYLQQQHAALDRLPSASRLSLGTQLTHFDHSASSLIARVLNHTNQQAADASSPPISSFTSASRIGSALHRPKTRPHQIDEAKDEQWDELEITRYSGLDETLHTISDAISQVLLASSHVQTAYSHLSTILQKYISRAARLRDNALLLRLTPVSVLVERLQQVINASGIEQKRQALAFEVTGEKIELDSTILEALIQPLTSLLHTCLADILVGNTDIQDQLPRGWLYLQNIGNEILLELGFSMTVQGGALEMVQNAVRQVGGTLALQRNTQGGISFLFYVPRTQGTLRGLLVRVGKQQVIVPFSQVQYIDDEKHAELDITYHLHRLLDTSHEGYPKQHTTPILVLPKGISRLVAGVLVDEVLTDVEVVVKPLPRYLQRPGITSATIDGKGNVQLVLNLPELIRHYNTVLRHTLPAQEETPRPKTTTRRVLVADDSLVMRQSLLQTLNRAGYETAEASDGMEALEQLTKNPPDIFLLDMEMPNLSGYDVLSIMHLYHELNNVKVVMLTSRASEKHKRHALELGAHDYLIKPCKPEVLLETIERLLS